MKAAEYLEAFVERYKGIMIKIVLTEGRVLNGTLSRCPKQDKADNKAYAVTSPKTMIVFNVDTVVYIYDKKRIRKKRSG